jgi:hypothetical protein
MHRTGISSLILFLLFTVTLAVADENENEKAGTSAIAESNHPVTTTPRAKTRAISNQIDKLVQAQLKEHDQTQNPLCEDEVFLRRVYLDIVGRIPSLPETRQFLNSKKKDKRELLIDRLLDSYGYVSRQYNYFADLLRIQSRANQVVGQPYIDFVKDSLESNKPYDQFVRDLLVAEGPMISRDNGAVGYYLRDRNMPEDNMSNTIRIFLGTRLECAQCHDHPFDVWTQKQYYEMVAFTGGVMTRLDKIDSKYAGSLNKLRRSTELNDSEKAAVRRLLQPLTIGVTGTGTGLARLPENFLGDDGDDFDIVKARTMFEGKELVKPKLPSSKKKPRVNKRYPQRIQGVQEIDSRFAYADWMTSPDNPRFTTVIANRLWKQAMGLGLIEPVDDLTAKTKASNPELMEFLTETMVELDYDMKQFLRAVYNSRTYQSSAMASDIADPNQFYFNGPVVRRMTAEQIWDSLLTLTIPEVDQRQTVASVRMRGLSGRGDLYERYDELRELSAEDLIARVKGYDQARMQGMQKQASKAEKRKLDQRKNELGKKIREAAKAGNRERVTSLMVERDELIAEYRQSILAGQLNRASEIASPAPAGHFLREFGQSDRETIENSNVEPAVTQALSLMNGFLETRIASNNSTVLMRNLVPARTEEQAVNIVYLSMLNRRPNRTEERVWANDFKKYSKEEVISDLIWTLANTNEFIFVK